ncbi:MAG: hypothetical protein AABY22_19665, partial [Nanoarchaeota archaeon]
DLEKQFMLSGQELQALHIDIQREIKTALKKLASGEIKGKELTAQLLGFSTLKVNNFTILGIEEAP